MSPVNALSRLLVHSFRGNYVFIFPISTAEGATIFGFVWVRGTKKLCKFQQIREDKSRTLLCYHCMRRFSHVFAVH